MARNLRSGLRQSLKAGLAGGFASNDIFTTASLDLNFAKYKNIGSLVTFTRASSGTYVGSDGLIKTATTNHLLQSEDFSTSWNSTGLLAFGSGSIVDATTAPDGTLTADLITEDTTVSALHRINQGSLTARAGSNTVSVYAKRANGTRNIEINANALTSARAVFNLGNGTVGEVSFGSASIQAVGDGWYRCSVTGTSAGTTSTLFLQLCNDTTSASSTYTGDGTSGIYLWGAQLEQSSTVGEYVKTTSTINSAPRFDHDPTTGESLGLLVEESRANLLLRSEEFNDAAWTTARASITANAALSPASTLTADKLVEDTSASNTHVIFQSTSFVSGVDYTMTVFAKAAERNYMTIVTGSVASTSVAVRFDLTSGTAVVVLGSPVSYDIQSYGDGWYRCQITQSATSSISDSWQIRIDSGSSTIYTGDGTSGIYIWGAQLEEGSFPTSFIKTEGTTVTRSADVASISSANFSSWYRQDEGTFYADVLYKDKLANTRLFFTQETSTDFNSRHGLVGGGNSTASLGPYGETVIAGVNQTSGLNQGGPAANTRYKTVFAFAEDNFAFTRNGATPVTDDSGNVPTSQGMAWIGQSDGANYMCAPIKRLTFWPTRLPDSTLQTITN